MAILVAFWSIFDWLIIFAIFVNQEKIMARSMQFWRKNLQIA